MATKKTEAAKQADTKTEATATGTQTAERKFSKSQLVGSKRFANRRDILNVKLENNKQYSISEAEAIITEFMKGKGE